MVVTLVNFQWNTSILFVWIDLSMLSIKEQLNPLIWGSVFELKLRKWPELSDIFWCKLFAKNRLSGHLRNFNSKTRPPIKGYLCSFRLSTLRSIHTSKIEVFHCKLTKVHNHVYLKHWKFQPFPNINGCNFGQFSVKHFNFVCVNRSEYAEYKRTVKSFDLR